MAQNGVDYSFARPSPATLAALGYTFVMRYLSEDNALTHGKILFAAEAAALHAAGLSIGLVFETSADPLANNAGTDHAGGVADATLAVGQANALGVPADRPIYVAVDVGSAYAGNLSLNARYQNYFQGWVDTIGLARVGFYGGSILWSYLFPRSVVSGYFWEASALSWSGYQVLYPGAIIQQGISGSPAGTDPDTAYVIDFGQWPNASQVLTPPPVHSGATLQANVANTTSYAQPQKQSLITPTTGHDQVVYSVTTSDATLATGSHNSFYEIPTNIAQTAYPIGTFSYDGGQTYNDFGFQLPTIPGGTGIYPGVQLQPVVDPSGNIFFNGTNTTGHSVNLIINIALLASYAPSTLPSGSQILGNTLSYTNVYPKLTQDDTTRVYSTYRRIAKDSVSGTGNVTIAHGQAMIPNIMFWVNVGGNTTINPVGWQSTGSLGALGIKMDSTNLYFHVDAGTYANCYYRVYQDN